MRRRRLAPYVVPTVVASIASIVGGALIAGAWTGEAPKKSATIAGVGLLALGALIGFQQVEAS